MLHSTEVLYHKTISQAQRAEKMLLFCEIIPDGDVNKANTLNGWNRIDTQLQRLAVAFCNRAENSKGYAIHKVEDALQCDDGDANSPHFGIELGRFDGENYAVHVLYIESNSGGTY